MSQRTSPVERALLLGAESSTIDPTGELKAILKDRFRVEIVPVEQISPTSRDVERILQRLNPDVIFIVVPHSLGETTKLLKSIQQAASNIPIIVVLETCEPDQLV